MKIETNGSKPVTRRWRRRVLFDWHYVRIEARREYRLAFILFWSLLLSFFCHQYIVSVGIVTDRSMLPTLSDGSYFLVNKYLYRLRQPQRGDIVVFWPHPLDEERYVKRIIGIGGDALLIRGGQVFLNGHRLTEPYALGTTFPDFGPVWIEPGTYFVMGDNRVDSQDSRHFGSIVWSSIEGNISPGKLFPFW